MREREREMDDTSVLYLILPWSFCFIKSSVPVIFAATPPYVCERILPNPPANATKSRTMRPIRKKLPNICF